MEENKIPTVSEFTKSKDPGFLYGVNGYGIGQKFEDLMIEFAKMHVEKALESAEHATNTRGIQHCYTLENIK